MEKRKVQKVGHCTLSVSLPKEWTDSADVKHGDTIYLDQKENDTLIIFSEKLLKKEGGATDYFINCDAITEAKLLERLIVASYLQGAETIKISASTRIKGTEIENVRNIVRRLIGLNIIEMSSNEIILQCSIDPTKFKIYSLLQRLSIITSTMLHEALEALIKLNCEFANDIIKRENEANSIYWLITRLSTSAQGSQTLAKEVGWNEVKSPCIRLISKNLERIADCSESIAKTVLDLSDLKDEIDPKELDKLTILNQMTKEMFQKTIDSFFSEDMITANTALNLREKIDDEAQSRRRTARIPYFRAITIMLSMITENSASIAVVTINNKVSKSNHLP